MTFLTSQQAYLAMYAFLVEEFRLTGSGELGGLLGGMSLLADGGTADPAVLEQWDSAVKLALAGDVDADLRLTRSNSDEPE